MHPWGTFFFSSRRRHTRLQGDWSSDVCSSDLVSVMGAEREALAGELRQVRLEADDVLRNIPTGIVTVDQEGHLLYCNPAAEHILGVKERQWRGRSIMPEFAKIAPEFWAAITATARRGVRAMRVEALVRRPDRTFPIGVTTTTLDLEPDGAPRVTAIFTDISDSKRLEELRSEEHTSELQSPCNLVCRLLLEKKKIKICRRLSRQIKIT